MVLDAEDEVAKVVKGDGGLRVTGTGDEGDRGGWCWSWLRWWWSNGSGGGIAAERYGHRRG